MIPVSLLPYRRDRTKTCLWQQDGYPHACKSTDPVRCRPCHERFARPGQSLPVRQLEAEEKP